MLEKYHFILRDYVRRRQGVYALYRGGKLYYVGLAGNLRSRLTMHLRDRHRQSWDSFSVYLCVGDTHLRELEALILRIVQPAGNKQKGKFPRSEDLRRKFGRAMHAYQRQEFQALIGNKPKPTESAVEEPSTMNGRKPILAPFIKGPMNLRVRFKGKLLHARVRRDARIRFAGRLYHSPSLAGAAACQRRTCNGWKFWEYERASGDWVLLDELRR
jgi:hypothetical protein